MTLEITTTVDQAHIIKYKEIGYNWGTVCAPFNNCQVFTIGWAAAVFHKRYNDQHIKMFLSEAIKLVNMRSLCVMDIHDSKVQDVITALSPFIKEVRSKMPYKSTNNSNMCIILVEFDLTKICK